jgi:hypothetical protein
MSATSSSSPTSALMLPNEQAKAHCHMIDSAEEFVRLRTSEGPEDYNRAANEAATVEVWKDVIRRFPDMKQWVIHNKQIQLEILELMARDTSASIRSCVADKRKLGAQLFEALSRDADEGVRARIAYNQKVPVEILQRLAADEAELVRQAAATRLARPAEG